MRENRSALNTAVLAWEGMTGWESKIVNSRGERGATNRNHLSLENV